MANGRFSRSGGGGGDDKFDPDQLEIRTPAAAPPKPSRRGQWTADSKAGAAAAASYDLSSGPLFAPVSPTATSPRALLPLGAASPASASPSHRGLLPAGVSPVSSTGSASRTPVPQFQMPSTDAWSQNPLKDIPAILPAATAQLQQPQPSPPKKHRLSAKHASDPGVGTATAHSVVEASFAHREQRPEQAARRQKKRTQQPPTGTMV
jgi:hypothetical protein